MMKKVMNVYLQVSMFFLPILMFPLVTDAFGFGKNWLLMAGAIVGMLLWVAQILSDKEVEVKTNKALWLLGAMVVWAWASWWFRLTLGAKMRSFMDIGGVGSLTAAWAFFFLWLQNGSETEREKQLNWLTVSGVLVMISSLVVFLIPVSKLPIVWPKNSPVVSIGADWSLAGSLFSEGVLMLFLAMEWGRRLMAKLKNGMSSYITEAVVTSILTLALLLDIFRIFKSGWVSLDGNSAWVIAVETFKRSPIWGVGPGNFGSAFYAFRPDTFNLTKYWSGSFGTSSSGLFELWTTLGSVGMVIAGLIIATVAKLKKDYNFLKIAVFGLMAAFLPFNLLGTMFLLWLMVGSFDRNNKTKLELKVGAAGFNVVPWAVGAIVVGVSIFGSYWMYRTIAGDIFMRRSLVAASKNDGGETYNLQIKAIGMNPNMGDYRKIYSQTNLALASNLLANKEITDADKEKASVLIQQAAREGKAAITLEENNPTYWVNLALIYRNIVGVVDGAADWSYQAYQQAIALEPANAITKLDIGGLLFAAAKYDEADRVFEQVVTSKPDFANGWYNFAYTAKKLNKLDQAVLRLTQAVALVPPTSGDYEKANKELNDWKKELDDLNKKTQAQTEQKQPETLKAPTALPTGTAEEKVNVPAGELAPPKVQITPSVSPTAGVPKVN